MSDVETRASTSRASDLPTDLGEWWQFRGNRTLTGRSALRGMIQKPAIHWRHFCGARETYLALEVNGAGVDEQTLPLPTTDLQSDQWQAMAMAWGIESVWFDLDDNGVAQSISPELHHKLDRFFPDDPAWYRLQFESIFNTPSATVASNSQPVYGRLFRRANGEWQQLWQSEPIPVLFHANAIVGDFDADGVLETAIVPWYDLVVLDLATGSAKYQARFKPEEAQSGRAYGWLGAFDVDQCGRSEFVILADFENHIEVMGWEEGKLTRLWYRLVERGITRKTTVLHPGTNPVQDIDGDGKLEIVLSIFNENDDNLWHVVAFDAKSGEILLDLPGHYLSGMCDVDGDGVTELFCTAVEGSVIPSNAPLSLRRWRNRQLSTLWQGADSAFQLYTQADFPLNVNGGLATGRKTILTGSVGTAGQIVFCTRRRLDLDTGLVELRFWQVETDGSTHEIGTVAGPYLQALTMRAAAGNGSILVLAQKPGDEAASLSYSGISVNPLLSRRITMPLTTVVAGKLAPDEPPTLLAQGACDTLDAFRPNQATSLWRKAGRIPAPKRDLVMDGGFVLADLLGNGTLATLAATESPDGYARMVAYAPDGRALWHRDFDRFPGALPPWNIGGLTYYFAGKFSDPNRDDVLVHLRRNTMHSDESYLLDGRTGETIWHRTQGPDIWGCGGGWIAAYDFDHDGRDDILTWYPHVFFGLQGPSGDMMVWEICNKIFNCPAFYAQPVVADILHEGDPQLFFAGSAYMLGLMDKDMQVRWRSDPASGTPAVTQCLGDLDGDGTLELVGPGYLQTLDTTNQEFRALDAATGALKWRLPLPGSGFIGNNVGFPDSPTMPVVADLDGDGRDECIFAVVNTLYAVGATADGTAGEVRWTLEFPDRLGTASIADANGDGTLQILVACADGYVYGIGA